MENIKLVILGDGAVGKSCFLITYATGSFPGEYVPTVFDNYSHNVMIDGKPYNIGLWDTAGQEDYDRLRPLCYPQTDIFLLCYCVENRCSFENITEKWIPEVRHHMGNEVPILIVGMKTDLREGPPSGNNDAPVTYQEGKDMADKMKLNFCEVSSLRQKGVAECMDCALKMAVRKIHWQKKNTKRKGIMGFFSRTKTEAPETYPPVMPPAGKAPWVEVETSVFADQWRHLLEEPRHADVEFLVEGRHKVQAHKVVLAAASEFFRKSFGLHQAKQSKKKNQLAALNDENFSRSDLISGYISGIDNVYEAKVQGSIKTVVELSMDITGKAFAQVLEFLYTGIPDLPKDTPKEELENLKNVARIFQLPFLETVCVNIEKDEAFLNPSIGTYLNDETGQMMKGLFLNQETLSDVTFDVQGSKFYAHKVILSARCEVLSAMFGGNFAEGNPTDEKREVRIFDTTPENFLSLLEYLYTDHAPIEEGDSVGLLVLSDLFCQTRLLNLCELYITKEVDRSCSKNIAKADVEVIGLLHVAQIHNAAQLSKWCLHFISSNYQAFQQRPEFPALTGENLDYVTEHQWPPLSYLKEIEEYEKECTKTGQKCVVM